MDNRPRTIICDIDGVLLKHKGDITQQHLSTPEVLPGVLTMLRKWDIEGCRIILITGRRESTRYHTEEQLANCGILYDALLFGVSGGTRVLINDRKSCSNIDTAVAINLARNSGFVV